MARWPCMGTNHFSIMEHLIFQDKDGQVITDFIANIGDLRKGDLLDLYKAERNLVDPLITHIKVVHKKALKYLAEKHPGKWIVKNREWKVPQSGPPNFELFIILEPFIS